MWGTSLVDCLADDPARTGRSGDYTNLNTL